MHKKSFDRNYCQCLAFTIIGSFGPSFQTEAALSALNGNVRVFPLVKTYKLLKPYSTANLLGWNMFIFQ